MEDTLTDSVTDLLLLFLRSSRQFNPERKPWAVSSRQSIRSCPSDESSLVAIEFQMYFIRNTIGIGNSFHGLICTRVSIVASNWLDYRASILPHRYRKPLAPKSLRRLRRYDNEGGQS